MKGTLVRLAWYRHFLFHSKPFKDTLCSTAAWSSWFMS
jgi:hypothetical protein